jgi:hypothetical protein
VACAAGQVQAEVGATACATCPEGKHDDESEHCANCAPGQVQASPGQTKCTACSVDSFADLQHILCVDCLPGHSTSGAVGTTSSDCAAVDCPGNSTGTIAAGCTCVEGTVGEVEPISDPPYFLGSCLEPAEAVRARPGIYPFACSIGDRFCAARLYWRLTAVKRQTAASGAGRCKKRRASTPKSRSAARCGWRSRPTASCPRTRRPRSAHTPRRSTCVHMSARRLTPSPGGQGGAVQRR